MQIQKSLILLDIFCLYSKQNSDSIKHTRFFHRHALQLVIYLSSTPALLRFRYHCLKLDYKLARRLTYIPFSMYLCKYIVRSHKFCIAILSIGLHVGGYVRSLCFGARNAKRNRISVSAKLYLSLGLPIKKKKLQTLKSKHLYRPPV